ncbi:MAG: AraC family transcriptional regulator [Opitutae bacterium]|nr:AraC family transcriptional regulator [Opitutae bacterium]MDG1301452.1 AraC family transcriptional regulator [Opitutae bacterium]
MAPLSTTHLAATGMQSDFLASLRPGQLLEALFDCVPGAFFFVKDRESRFMAGGRSFAQTLGETSMEVMIGKTDYDYSPDFLADGFYADDQRVMGTGQAIYNNIELVPSADGSLDWLCTTKIPLFDTQGAVVGLAGVARIIRDHDAVYAEHPEMHRIVNHVRQHYRDKLSIADLATIGGISVSSQERLFKKTFGLTPLMYLRRTRLNAACQLLRSTAVGLSDISVQCGFNDQTNMTRAFRQELKITPLKYRRNFSEKPAPRNKRKTSMVLRAGI